MCVSERPPPLCGITVRGTVSPAGRFPHGPRHRAWPLTARAVATLSPQWRGDRPPPPLGTSLHFPPSPPGTPSITLAPVTLLLKGGPRCVEGWLAGDSTILLNGDTSHGLCWEAAGTLAS